MYVYLRQAAYSPLSVNVASLVVVAILTSDRVGAFGAGTAAALLLVAEALVLVVLN